jgi:hypothetical protein
MRSILFDTVNDFYHKYLGGSSALFFLAGSSGSRYGRDCRKANPKTLTAAPWSTFVRQRCLQAAGQRGNRLLGTSRVAAHRGADSLYRLRVSYFRRTYAPARSVEARITSEGSSMILLRRGAVFAVIMFIARRAAISPILWLCWSMLESGTRSESS